MQVIEILLLFVSAQEYRDSERSCTCRTGSKKEKTPVYTQLGTGRTIDELKVKLEKTHGESIRVLQVYDATEQPKFLSCAGCSEVS